MLKSKTLPWYAIGWLLWSADGSRAFTVNPTQMRLPYFTKSILYPHVKPSPCKPSHTTATTTQLAATWSDMKAVRDYQDFLASGQQKVPLTEDGPSVIMMPFDGPSDLGEVLQTMGMGDDVVLAPGNDLPAQLGDSATYPIYITLPPWQLTEFLTNMPASYMDRADDFVFFSGGLAYGNIEDVLKEKGMYAEQHRVTELRLARTIVYALSTTCCV
jgi:hypothetical protein